jgi:hypothetical protein
LLIPWVVAIGVGLSVNNALAVLDGLCGRDATFIRTPKFGIQSTADCWQQKAYRASWTPTMWVELALAAYFAVGCVVAWQQRLLLALPSLALICAGFAYVGGLSLW